MDVGRRSERKLRGNVFKIKPGSLQHSFIAHHVRMQHKCTVLTSENVREYTEHCGTVAP